MEYLHYEFDATPLEVVEVTLDHAANVQLLDEENFQNYRDHKRFDYHGGYAQTSPFRLKPPYAGRWHLVVDLGGGAGSVRASLQIIPQALASSDSLTPA
jgi:hypothetical protein